MTLKEIAIGALVAGIAAALVAGVVPTTDVKEAFTEIDYALLVGAMPRRAGMERSVRVGRRQRAQSVASARFDAAVNEGRLPAGFDERFVRLWRFYLTYCEAGFRAGNIDVHQVTLVKDG